MAMDMFLKLEGIEGESTDSKHKDEIEVLSFSWGESNAGSLSTGGTGTGKVSMQDFHFVASTQRSSVELFLACATGVHIPDGQLTLRKAGGSQQEFLTIKLSDILISSYNLGGANDGSDGAPTDSFSLNFSKVEFAYSEQRPDGTMALSRTAGYDLKLQKKV